jgi:hypothetical protein
MSRRFFELAVRARRLVTRTTTPARAPRGTRLTARRQLGGELTQFSFRLAFMIDLSYVGLGALGGAAVDRATSPNASVADRAVSACSDSAGSSTARAPSPPNGTAPSSRSLPQGLPFPLSR